MERVIKRHMYRQNRDFCGSCHSEYRFRRLPYTSANPNDLRVTGVTVPET